jgi:Na+/H+ antiporter NhaB
MPPLQDLLRLIRLIILTMSVQEPTTTLAEQLKEQEYNATLQHKISQVVQDTTQQDRDKHSSLQTIFTISNGMVGSAAIVLPVLYYSYGVVNGLIVSFVICILSCNTTLLILDHNLPKEVNL